MTTRTVICAIALCLSGAACDEKLSDVAGPTPNLQPTLSSIQREIFNVSDRTGRLAYQELVGQPSRNKPGAIRVVPGEPDRSYFLHKLEGRSDIVGVRMPRSNGPYLTDGQISIIRRWIELGARND